jgi:predicted DNA-binding transcriptional regulator AlpA
MAASRFPSDAPADAGLLTVEQVQRITQLSRFQLYRIAADPRQARRMGVERLAGSIRFRRSAIEAIVGKIEVEA